ncbi:uncharacterized protein BDZ99DRAFT_439485 [Mytilinidion resinicola]|uniref:DNA recombination and repair protein Rad51-like C-terminal domain-containing protein n=1 Tax=Mytilinidion resinicola TaxID=574789 RepID=A0A6A6YUF8_9PEZI|nr:uncharacterized protein BDZ99DRAFT_439485 [Mytilinidion resinicola]KAF2812390.1 hypothetical protein BDZ99DRAFT_439485 [Mytilinidion resinicola]
MSVEELGRRVLRDVEEGGLDELIKDLWKARNAGQSMHFGIPELDRLVPVVEQPPALPLPQPETFSSSPPLPVQTTAIKKPLQKMPMIELISSGPGAGKTSLIYYIIAVAILPSTYSSTPIGGQSSAVVVLDTDNRFRVERLVEVMASYVSSRLRAAGIPQQQNTDGMRDLIHACLAHVHIFHLQTMHSLLATLKSLPEYLESRTAHRSAHRRLHSIFLDSASAFFWPTRAAEENGTSPVTAMETYALLARELTTVSQRFCCAVVASAWDVGAGQLFTQRLRASLPMSWSSFPTLRLALRRVPVPRFTVGMTVQEAEAEKEMRWGVVSRGWCEAWVLGGSGLEGFFFRVGEGVDIEGDSNP